VTPLPLSILVPTLNERGSLPFLLADLATLRTSCEVIVADGGSSDDTATVAARLGARVVFSERGRGCQLAAAAASAEGFVLCALHADVRLPPRTVAAIDAYAAQPPATAMAFSLGIGADGASFAIISALANLRSRLLHLPYGDQGLLMTRGMYDRCGGYPPVPIMEDVMLVRALARSVGIVVSPERVVASPRRWTRDGPWRRSMRNLAILSAYAVGASPARIAGWYGVGDTGSRHG
jgi:rSAM/selenodomain-associated transferase 2